MKQDYFLGLSEEGFHRVAYTEWGDASTTQPPVICVHGLSRNSRDFDFLAGYLEKQHRHVYCPDIVGRGDSDWLQNHLHYTFEQYIADMTAMIARTGAKQIDWVGTSMGGIIGMILASMPHSPIRRLVLNDIGPQIPVKGLSRLSKYVGKDPDFNSLEEAERYYRSTYAEFGTLDDAFWQHLTRHNVREISPGKYTSKVDHGVKQSPAKSKIAWKLLMNPHKALEGTFFDIDLWQMWRKITCPVLVIHGIHSDLLLTSIIEKMRSNRNNVEVLTINDAGHAPALVNATDHDIITRWLAHP